LDYFYFYHYRWRVRFIADVFGRRGFDGEIDHPRATTWRKGNARHQRKQVKQHFVVLYFFFLFHDQYLSVSSPPSNSVVVNLRYFHSTFKISSKFVEEVLRFLMIPASSFKKLWYFLKFFPRLLGSSSLSAVGDSWRFSEVPSSFKILPQFLVMISAADLFLVYTVMIGSRKQDSL